MLIHILQKAAELPGAEQEALLTKKGADTRRTWRVDLFAHQRKPFTLACSGIRILLGRGTRGVWLEKHPPDAAAAVAQHSLAAFIAGWVTTLFASALSVNSEAQEQAKRQRIPREADVIASSLVPETVLES